MANEEQLRQTQSSENALQGNNLNLSNAPESSERTPLREHVLLVSMSATILEEIFRTRLDIKPEDSEKSAYRVLLDGYKKEIADGVIESVAGGNIQRKVGLNVAQLENLDDAWQNGDIREGTYSFAGNIIGDVSEILPPEYTFMPAAIRRMLERDGNIVPKKFVPSALETIKSASIFDGNTIKVEEMADLCAAFETDRIMLEIMQIAALPPLVGSPFGRGRPTPMTMEGKAFIAVDFLDASVDAITELRKRLPNGREFALTTLLKYGATKKTKESATTGEVEESIDEVSEEATFPDYIAQQLPQDLNTPMKLRTALIAARQTAAAKITTEGVNAREMIKGHKAELMQEEIFAGKRYGRDNGVGGHTDGIYRPDRFGTPEDVLKAYVDRVITARNMDLNPNDLTGAAPRRRGRKKKPTTPSET